MMEMAGPLIGRTLQAAANASGNAAAGVMEAFIAAKNHSDTAHSGHRLHAMVMHGRGQNGTLGHFNGTQVTAGLLAVCQSEPVMCYAVKKNGSGDTTQEQHRCQLQASLPWGCQLEGMPSAAPWCVQPPC